jgi:hypothetical protein
MDFKNNEQIAIFIYLRTCQLARPYRKQRTCFEVFKLGAKVRKKSYTQPPNPSFAEFFTGRVERGCLKRGQPLFLTFFRCF